MPSATAHVHVDVEGRITGQAPADLPPGEYWAELGMPAPVSGLDRTPVKLSEQERGMTALRAFLDRPPHDSGP